jgi:hypothetical protein
MEQEAPPARIIVAYVLVAIAAITGLVFLIPNLIIAVGTAIGLAFGGGAVAASAVPWAAPVAAVGLGATGGAMTIIVLVRAVKHASEEPYDWVVPILGIGGGLILDVAKEFALGNVAVKIALSAVVAFLVVVAGACYKKGGLLWCAVAILLILLPPIYVLAQNLNSNAREGLREALRTIPGGTWLRIGGFIVAGVSVALLRHLTRASD